MDMPEIPRKKSRLWMVPVGLVALAVLIFAVSYAVHLIDIVTIDPQVKANADFVAEYKRYKAYIPCKQEEIPSANDVNTRLSGPLSAPQSDKLELGFINDKIGTYFRGYNRSGDVLPFTDYEIRGVTLSQPDDSSSRNPYSLRGGKLGGDRSEEFMTRGIRIGDTPEDALRILGEPDKTSDNEQYAFYYFDSEEGGQYLLSLEYSEQKLSMIDLSYTFNAPSTP